MTEMARVAREPRRTATRSSSQAPAPALVQRRGPLPARPDQLRGLSPASRAAAVHDLQAKGGNRADPRLLGESPPQLAATYPDHGGQLVQRCGDRPCSCEHEENQGTFVRSQAEPSTHASAVVPASVADTLRLPGQPLEPTVRQEMSSRLGHDFAAVRTHTDAAASRSAEDIGARAYAAGSHVVRGGEYQPSTLAGRQLLAHELTHVVQESSTPAGPLMLGDPHSPAETEAERVAVAVTDGPAIKAPSERAALPVDELYALQRAVRNRTTTSVVEDVGSLEGRVPPPIVPDGGVQVQRQCDPSTQSCLVEEGHEDSDAGVSRIDTELVEELAHIDARGETVGPAVGSPQVPASAQLFRSAVQPGQTYAFAATVDFASTTGYSVPEGILASESLAAQGTAAAESLVAAQGLTTAETTVVEGSTLAESLITGGEAILAVEAGGAGELEAATGPPGWVIGAVVLLVGGVATGVGYLLLRPKRDLPITATVLQQAAGTQAVPQAPTRRHPNQTCDDDRLDELQAKKDRICNTIPGESCNPSKVSPKRLARRPCSEIRLRIQAIRDCIAIRQLIQDECFRGVPDPRHQDAFEMLQNGLDACLALETVNCAPGHPMANL